MDSLERLIENFHNIDKKLEVVSELLKQHLTDDTENLSRIVSSLSSIDKRLDENTFQLEVHIQGVKEAQENNKILREELALYKQEVYSRMQELEKPQIVAKGLLWLVGAVSAIVGLVLLFKQLL